MKTTIGGVEVDLGGDAGDGVAPAHHCHAAGCTRTCKPEFLMCGIHWRKVPLKWNRLVYANYRDGQCDDKRPSRTWTVAAWAAIAAVAQQEGKEHLLPDPIRQRLAADPTVWGAVPKPASCTIEPDMEAWRGAYYAAKEADAAIAAQRAALVALSTAEPEGASR